jgi:uncharacterized damage-inducible protein DinB
MPDEVRYPIGEFHFVEPTVDLRRSLIRQFKKDPAELRKAVAGLSEKRLLTRYRDGGWTLAQVVHHIAESDANAYPRLKYALTEDSPVVMVAPQALWAEVADARSPAIELSLGMFESIRLRWAEAWESMAAEQYDRKWRHARFGEVGLDFLLQQYAWHSRHHTAQITSCRKRMGW